MRIHSVHAHQVQHVIHHDSIYLRCAIIIIQKLCVYVGYKIYRNKYTVYNKS
jgi:Zn-dependent protease with chaperone function